MATNNDVSITFGNENDKDLDAATVNDENEDEEINDNETDDDNDNENEGDNEDVEDEDDDDENKDDDNANEEEDDDDDESKQKNKNIQTTNEKNISLTEHIKQERNAQKNMKVNDTSLFCESILQRPILVGFHEIGNTIEDVLLQKLKAIEGKCGKEGFIRPKSIEIITYSSGVCKGSDVEFIVTFKCLVCIPVEGMRLVVKVTNKTKAGIRANSRDPLCPIDVFVTRDHNLKYEKYDELEVGDIFGVRVIGFRFELNDTHISVIADIDDDKPNSILHVVEE